MSCSDVLGAVRRNFAYCFAVCLLASVFSGVIARNGIRKAGNTIHLPALMLLKTIKEPGSLLREGSIIAIETGNAFNFIESSTWGILL